MNIGSLTISLGVDTKGTLGAQVAIQQLARDVSSRTKQMNASIDTFNARLTQMAGKLRSLGWLAVTVFTAPILMLGRNMMKSAQEFEYSMAKIVGLVGIAKDQVDDWKGAILQLAPVVGKTHTELAEAMFFVTSAGLRGQVAMEALEWSAKGAAAGLGETKTVADLVTSAMNAYGWETLNAQKATDILVATVREGKAEAPALVSAMGMVLPIASEMGVTFNQVGAAIASMTRTGTKASMASVQLRQILVSLIKPSKQAQTALATMGTSAEVLRERIKEDGLLEALSTLKGLTEEYGDALMARVFGNVRALTGVLDLMGANLESTRGIFERMENTLNDTNKAYDAVADTIEQRMNKANASLKTSMGAFGEIVASVIIPMIERWAERIKKLQEWINSLTESQKKWIVILGITLAAIGPVALILGVLSYIVTLLASAIGGLALRLRIMNKVMLTNPIWAMMFAFAALTGGIIRYIQKVRESKEVTEDHIATQDKFKRGLDLAEEVNNGNDALRDRIAVIEDLNKVQLENLAITLQNKKNEQEAFAAVSFKSFGSELGTNAEATIRMLAKTERPEISLGYVFKENPEALKIALQIVEALRAAEEFDVALQAIEKRLTAIGKASRSADLAEQASSIFQEMMTKIDAVDNAVEAYKKYGIMLDENKEKAEIFKGALRALAELGLEAAGDEIRIVVEYLGQLGLSLEEIDKRTEIQNKKLKDNEDAIKSLTKVWEDYANTIRYIEAMSHIQGASFDKNGELLKHYQTMLQGLVKDQDKYKGIDAIFQMLGGVAPSITAIDHLNQEIANLQKTISDTEAAQEWSKFQDDIALKLEKNALKQKVLGKHFNETTANINVLVDALQTATSAFNINDEAVQKAIETYKKMLEEMQELAALKRYVLKFESAFEDAFNSIIDGSENAFQAMADAFSRALKRMLAELAAKAAMFMFLNILSGGTGKLADAAGKLILDKSMGQYMFGTGMASGGKVPPGYPNDSFHARLTSGEKVIPLGHDDVDRAQKLEITIKGKVEGQDLAFILDEVRTLTGRTR